MNNFDTNYPEQDAQIGNTGRNQNDQTLFGKTYTEYQIIISDFFKENFSPSIQDFSEVLDEILEGDDIDPKLVIKFINSYAKEAIQKALTVRQFVYSEFQNPAIKINDMIKKCIQIGINYLSYDTKSCLSFLETIFSLDNNNLYKHQSSDENVLQDMAKVNNIKLTKKTMKYVYKKKYIKKPKGKTKSTSKSSLNNGRTYYGNQFSLECEDIYSEIHQKITKTQLDRDDIFDLCLLKVWVFCCGLIKITCNNNQDTLPFMENRQFIELPDMTAIQQIKNIDYNNIKECFKTNYEDVEQEENFKKCVKSIRSKLKLVFHNQLIMYDYIDRPRQLDNIYNKVKQMILLDDLEVFEQKPEKKQKNKKPQNQNKNDTYQESDSIEAEEIGDLNKKKRSSFEEEQDFQKDQDNMWDQDDNQPQKDDSDNASDSDSVISIIDFNENEMIEVEEEYFKPKYEEYLEALKDYLPIKLAVKSECLNTHYISSYPINNFYYVVNISWLVEMNFIEKSAEIFIKTQDSIIKQNLLDNIQNLVKVIDDYEMKKRMSNFIQPMADYLINQQIDQIKIIKSYDITKLKNFLKDLEQIADGEQKKFVRSNFLKVPLMCFKSQYMEKKILGFQQILQVIQETSYHMPLLQSNEVVEWLEDNNIFDLVFGEFSHVEIIKLSYKFVKFLYSNSKCDQNRINYLFDLAVTKHDAMQKHLYQMLGQLVRKLNFDDLQSVFLKIKGMKRKDLDANMIGIIGSIFNHQVVHRQGQKRQKIMPQNNLIVPKVRGSDRMPSVDTRKQNNGLNIQVTDEKSEVVYSSKQEPKQTKEFELFDHNLRNSWKEYNEQTQKNQEQQQQEQLQQDQNQDLDYDQDQDQNQNQDQDQDQDKNQDQDQDQDQIIIINPKNIEDNNDKMEVEEEQKSQSEQEDDQINTPQNEFLGEVSKFLWDLMEEWGQEDDKNKLLGQVMKDLAKILSQKQTSLLYWYMEQSIEKIRTHYNSSIYLKFIQDVTSFPGQLIINGDYTQKSQFLDKLEQDYNFIEAIFESIQLYKISMIEMSTNQQTEDIKQTYVVQMNQRLEMILDIYSNCTSFLTKNFIDQLWKILVEEIHWDEEFQVVLSFLKIVANPQEKGTVLLNSNIQYIFTNYLSQIEDVRFTGKDFECFEIYFLQMNIYFLKFKKANIFYQSQNNDLILNSDDIEGIQKVWQIFFNGNQEASSLASNLLQKILGFQSEDEDFIYNLKKQYIQNLIQNIRKKLQEYQNQQNQEQSVSSLSRSISLLVNIVENIKKKIEKEKLQNGLGEPVKILILNQIKETTNQGKFTIQANQNNTIEELFEIVAQKMIPILLPCDLDMYFGGTILSQSKKKTIKEMKIKDGVQITVNKNTIQFEEEKTSTNVIISDEDVEQLKMMFEKSDEITRKALEKANGNMETAVNALLDPEYLKIYQDEIDRDAKKKEEVSKPQTVIKKDEKEIKEMTVFQELSDDQELFSLFFQILDLNNSKLEQQTWEFIQCLPVNKNLQEKYLALEDMQIGEFEDMFNNSSPYKFLYIIQILFNNVNCIKISEELQEQIQQRKQWRLQFAEKCLPTTIKSLFKNKNFIKNPKIVQYLVDIVKVYLQAFLECQYQEKPEITKRMKLAFSCWEQSSSNQENKQNDKEQTGNEENKQSNSDNEKETPGFPSPISSTSKTLSNNQVAQNNEASGNDPSQVSIENVNKQQSDAQNAVVDIDEFGELVKVIKQDQNQRQNLEKTLDFELIINGIIDNILQYKEYLDEDKNISQIIQSIYHMYLSVLVFQPTLLQSSLQNKEFEQAQMRLLLNSKSEQIRQTVSKSIVSLCTFMPSVELEAIDLQEQDFKQSRKYFFGLFLDQIEHIDIIQTEDFFICLSQLIKQMELADLQNLLDIKSLLKKSLERVFQRPIIENRRDDTEDKLLQGQILLIVSLFQCQKSLKKELSEEYDLLNEVYDMLFKFPDENNIEINFNLPKCKKQNTRKRVFDLLLEICKDNLENTQKLLEKISKIQKVEENNDDVKVDLKPYHGYVGLKNLGSTCYINSLLQQFFMIQEFRNATLNSQIKPQENDQEIDESLHTLLQLQYVFTSLEENIKQYIWPSKLIDSIRECDGTVINVRIQQDVNEFFNKIMDKLESDLKNTEQKDIVQQLIGGKISNEIISMEQEFPYYGESEEVFLTLNLEIKNKKNIQESLDTFIADDILEGDNKYHCDKYDQKIQVKKRCRIKSLPNNLIITLKRFEYDFTTFQKKKINDYFEFPHDLNLKKWTTQQEQEQESKEKQQKENAEEQKQKQEQKQTQQSQQEEKPKIINHPDSYYQYKLKGVLVHSGTSESGHYYSYIKDLKSEKWFEFNDAYVTDFDISKLDQECFGGDFNQNNNQNDFKLFDDYDDDYYKKCRNAYILFYERVQKTEVQCQQICELGVPQHLQKQVQHDNFNYLKQEVFSDKDYFQFMNSFLQMCNFQNIYEVDPIISYKEDDLKKLQNGIIENDLTYMTKNQFLEQKEHQLEQEQVDGQLSMEQYLQYPQMRAIKQSTMFAYDIFLKKKDVEEYQKWITNLITMFKGYIPANFWLLNYLSENQAILKEIYILSFNQDLKSLFSQLLQTAIRIVYKIEEDYIYQVDKVYYMTERSEQCQKTHVKKSCLLRFLDVFVDNLSLESNSNLSKLQEYYKIIKNIIQISPKLISYFTDKNGARNSYYESYIDLLSKNLNTMNQYNYPVYDHYNEKSLVSLVELIAELTKSHKTREMDDSKSYPSDDLQNAPQLSYYLYNKLIIYKSYLDKFHHFIELTDAGIQIVQHLCYENVNQSDKIMKVLMDIIQLNSYYHDKNPPAQIRNIFKVIFAILSIDDGQENRGLRFQLFMDTIPSTLDRDQNIDNNFMSWMKFYQIKEFQSVVTMLYQILLFAKNNSDFFELLQEYDWIVGYMQERMEKVYQNDEVIKTCQKGYQLSLDLFHGLKKKLSEIQQENNSTVKGFSQNLNIVKDIAEDGKLQEKRSNKTKQLLEIFNEDLEGVENKDLEEQNNITNDCKGVFE